MRLPRKLQRNKQRNKLLRLPTGLPGLVTFKNSRGTLLLMSEERDPSQLEFDPCGAQEADTLAQSILALNKKLLGEYLKHLGNESWQVRVKSARGLGSLKGVAVTAIPSLEDLLGDKDHRVRKAAGLALASIRSAS
jgi:HEAT repeat protein